MYSLHSINYNVGLHVHNYITRKTVGRYSKFWLFQGKSEATFSHSAHDNDNESDDDPTDLRYFEPAVSDDSDDNIQQHEVGRIKKLNF